MMVKYAVYIIKGEGEGESTHSNTILINHCWLLVVKHAGELSESFSMISKSSEWIDGIQKITGDRLCYSGKRINGKDVRIFK